MTKFSTSLIINASQEAVWKILSDVVHWHKWTPTIIKVEALNIPELKLGNCYKVYQPKLQPAEWTVTELRVNLSKSNFVWEAKSSGIHMVADHALQPINAKPETLLTLTFAFNGWLGKFIGRMYGKVTKEYLEIEALSLKKKVEIALRKTQE